MALNVDHTTRLQCMNLIIDRHYAGKFPSCSYYIGLFDGDELIGCVTYGTPPSSSLRSGLLGKGNEQHVIELNRLVLKYNRKNEASFLVSKSLKMIGDKVVISFADTSQGHIGTVYQACNFTYHGLSEKRTDWKIKGKEHLHGISVADEFRGVKNRSLAMREKYGDDFYLKDRPRKHRYIFIAGHRKFKQKMTSMIKYPLQDYPKE